MQPALIALALVLPDVVPPGPSHVAVLCRESSGRWPAIIWQAREPATRTVVAREGSRCRVLIRPLGRAAYLSSAEIEWAERAGPVMIRGEWLRTIRVEPQAARLTWIGARDTPDIECRSSGEMSECLFVPDDAAGVLVGRFDGAATVAFFAREESAASWRETAHGRFLRVTSTTTASVSVRALRLERALNRGAANLFEARSVAGIEIHPIDRGAFWIEGRAAGAFIELQSSGSAPLRIPIESLAGAPEVPIDRRLWPGELIEGDVRGRAGAAVGTTVIISRIIEGDARLDHESRPRERIAEVTTDDAGRFRFASLARARYELLALHPSYGRARAIVTAPQYPRLVLKPRARIRGRVLRNGIPAASASVALLPALEAVVAASNPLLLATEPVQSGIDGRFEITAPDEGQLVLAIRLGNSSVRIELGDAAALREVVDLGDIRLEDAQAIELIVDLPQGCSLRAAGPMGTAGLSIVNAVPVAPGRWQLTPPVPGRWLFVGVCGTTELALDPAIVEVQLGRRGPIVLKVRR